jgi:hypothetical protein
MIGWLRFWKLFRRTKAPHSPAQPAAPARMTSGLFRSGHLPRRSIAWMPISAETAADSIHNRLGDAGTVAEWERQQQLLSTTVPDHPSVTWALYRRLLS